MKNPVLSCVIYYYNNLNSLLRLLGSITSQSFKNFEVIIVDDASNEENDCINIINTYKKEYNAISLIKNDTRLYEKNSYLRGAIASTGKAINFINADDELWGIKNLEYNIQILIEKNADIVHFPAMRNVEGSSVSSLHEASLPLSERLIGGEIFGAYAISENYNMLIGNKIYSRRLLDKALIAALQGEQIHHASNMYIEPFLFFHAEKYIGTSEASYLYREKACHEGKDRNHLATLLYFTETRADYFKRLPEKREDTTTYLRKISQYIHTDLNEYFFVFGKKLRAILSECITSENKKRNVYILGQDHTRSLLQVLCFGPERPALRFFMNGLPWHIAFHKAVPFPSPNPDTAFFHILWLPIGDTTKSLSAWLGNEQLRIITGNTTSFQLSIAPLMASVKIKHRGWKKRCMAFLARLPFIRNRFDKCWLLVDRDFKADDNAEHLYRWIMRNRPTRNIFFALDKKSPDWPRLKKEGFRLINLKSLRYFFAWIHCAWLISSNRTTYITKEHCRRHYLDIVKHQFCFLQHGITMNYQSGLNKDRIDMLITAAHREYGAFASGTAYPYVYSDREIQLTGFPRHDELIRKAAAVKKPKKILIMPTWRKNLLDNLIPGTGQFPYSSRFAQSSYFQQWQAVLKSETLLASAQKHGYTLQFFPHPYIRGQLDDFDLSKVTVTPDTGGSLQDILADTALLITDYSSVNLEVALLRRPVLYFQFDRDTFLTQDHAFTQGYFDYKHDGFGDISLTVDDLCAKADALMQEGCAMHDKYRNRANAFFAFDDQDNCQRVYNALCKLAAPVSHTCGAIPYGLPSQEDVKSVRIAHVDHARHLLSLTCLGTCETLEHRFFINDAPCLPAFQRTFTITMPGGEIVFRHIIWLTYDQAFTSLEAHLNDEAIPIIHGRQSQTRLEAAQLFDQPNIPKKSFLQRCLALIARLPFVSSSFSGCWLLADRDFKADDNAEHLYRWIMRHHPERRLRFALDKKSPDWARLKKEGFNLVNLKSLWYFFAWVHSAWVISSNRTRYIARPSWRRAYADMVKHQFCFLQHGITKDYQPGFNQDHMDMIVTAARREYDTFANDQDYPYVYSEREVQLTGFPRHDELLRKARAVESPKTVLIMPTWRSNLVDKLLPGSGQFPYSERFSQSEYFRNWQTVLQSQRLQAAARENGYTVQFFPHPYIRQQLGDFNLDGVTVTPDAGGSIQDILADTGLLITDYSSIAMEAALIGRSVLYFQFDSDTFFTRDHAYTQGYFDYERDGFGDVVRTVDDLCAKAAALMRQGCRVDERYTSRADTFFAFRDQKNCQRVYDAICRLSGPVIA